MIVDFEANDWGNQRFPIGAFDAKREAAAVAAIRLAAGP